MIQSSRQSARVLGSAIATAVAITLTWGAGAQTPQQDEPGMPRQMHQDPLQQDPIQQDPIQQDQIPPGQARESGTAASATSAIVVGEVLDMRDVGIRGPIEDTHRVIKVETRNGTTMLVDIGNPRSHSDVNFRQGDRIVAVGKKARLDDRPVLFAKTVGELHSVGRHTVQSAAGTSERSAAPETTPRSDEVPQASLYYFQTDNLQTDRYGTYDEDFAWETDEQWYGNWRDADASRDQYRATDEDIYLYSDGETDDWSVWDW